MNVARRKLNFPSRFHFVLSKNFPNKASPRRTITLRIVHKSGNCIDLERPPFSFFPRYGSSRLHERKRNEKRKGKSARELIADPIYRRAALLDISSSKPSIIEGSNLPVKNSKWCKTPLKRFSVDQVFKREEKVWRIDRWTIEASK